MLNVLKATENLTKAEQNYANQHIAFYAYTSNTLAEVEAKLRAARDFGTHFEIGAHNETGLYIINPCGDLLVTFTK